MKHKLFLLAFAAILFAGCEGIKDDRNQPTPANVRLSWLLSVEIDALPSGVDAYSCIVYKAEDPTQNDVFTRTEIKLPELLQIPGAKLIRDYETGRTNNYAVSVFKLDVSGITIEEIGTLAVPVDLEAYVENGDTIRYPHTISFDGNGLKGKLHFRYDGKN